ncbi:MAG: hypothetical protein HY885_14905 [Deltaproteobacteria bacterium]|nr:hypothetical protein [Deltaproteobacteria bacterium]
MEKIIKAFQDSMAAAAFAEADEHESAREFLRAGKNAHKKILLGTDETQLAPKVVAYALNMCARLGVGLEIVQVLPEASMPKDLTIKYGNESLSPQEMQAGFSRRGILYEFFFGNASLEEEIMQHLAKRRDIMLFVLRMSGQGAKNQKAENDLVKKFQCPVVILDDPLPA